MMPQFDNLYTEYQPFPATEGAKLETLLTAEDLILLKEMRISLGGNNGAA